MSLVDHIAGGVGAPPSASAVTSFEQAFIDEARRSSSGEVVSIERSLGLDSVFAATRLISETGGTLPLKTYERLDGGGRVEADDPVYDLLHDEPNPEMTAADCWSLILTHGALWGNGFLGKRRAGGPVPELWPLLPERMQVGRRSGRKFYLYRREDGRQEELSGRDVIHVRGVSLDGLVGLSPIGLAREMVGAALAGQRFSGRFLANAAVPRGVLEVAGELSEPAAQKLGHQWQRAQGGRNIGRVAVLEGGVTFKPITMPLEDAQFVEQMKLSVQQVARIFGVAPELIGGESGGSLTYSTVEGQALAFLTYCLRPWLIRIEQALRRDPDLFPRRPGARRRRYPEFVQDAMLRSDAKTRAEVNAMALDPQKGWLNRSEVRDMENRPPESAGQSRPMPAERADRVTARMDETLAALRASRNGGTHAHA